MTDSSINKSVRMWIERVFFPRVYRRRMAILRFRKMDPLWRKYAKMQAKIMCEWIPKIYETPRNIILENMLNE